MTAEIHESVNKKNLQAPRWTNIAVSNEREYFWEVKFINPKPQTAFLQRIGYYAEERDWSLLGSVGISACTTLFFVFFLTTVAKKASWLLLPFSVYWLMVMSEIFIMCHHRRFCFVSKMSRNQSGFWASSFFEIDRESIVCLGRCLIVKPLKAKMLNFVCADGPFFCIVKGPI